MTNLEVLNSRLEAAHDTNAQTRTFQVFLNKELAEFLLERNLNNPEVKNRKINRKRVESFKRQILNGQMKNTGEPLIFTDQGLGIDLQHRCYGVLAAAKINPDAGYVTTVLTGLAVTNLIDNLLVMGVSHRSGSDLAGFAGVEQKMWKTVEFYLLPDNLKAGQVNNSLSKLEINHCYLKNKAFYDNGFAYISELFDQDPANNTDLGRERLAVFTAAFLKMSDDDPTLAKKFMEVFFSTTNATLIKIDKFNPVDSVRSHLSQLFATQHRDRSRPVVHVRAKLMKAFGYFKAFMLSHLRQSSWDFSLTEPKTSKVA